MPRLVSDDVPTSGRPVLHPANGHRDNLHASKKKRKAKAGSNRFGNRRLSRSEQSGRLGLLLLCAANASPSLRFNRIRAMPDVIRQQVSATARIPISCCEYAVAARSLGSRPALALRARGGWLMNLDEFRALTPWSFFLPMLLAVTLGVLIANALGAALFGGDDAAEPPGGAVEAAAAENDEAPAAAEANSADRKSTRRVGKK